MKIAVTIVLTILLSFAAGLYLPWQSMAVVSFLIAVYMNQKPAMAYLTGFVSMFLLWVLLAWWIDVQNDSILSARMATLFPLGGSSLLLILVTGLVAGIIGGLSALTGSYFRKYIQFYRSKP
jgi:hypothetical protein